MMRTQLYLPDGLYQNIRLISLREKKPRAELMRDFLSDGVKKTLRKRNAGDALMDIVKLGKKLKIRGPADLSSRIDDYLYGDL